MLVIVYFEYRFNLDPFQSVTDDDTIWDILETVKLKEVIFELPQKLGVKFVGSPAIVLLIPPLLWHEQNENIR
jgi:hypothetical protein